MNLFFLPFHYVITGEPQHQLRYYRRTAAPIENRKKGGESEIVKCQIGPMFRSLNFAARGSKWRVK